MCSCVKLAEGTVTGVMVGIVGTAAAQAVVAMIDCIASAFGVAMLTFTTFIFSMVPVISATLIWLGAAVWLYDSGQTGWAVSWCFGVCSASASPDNFVKPILISRTSSLPLPADRRRHFRRRTGLSDSSDCSLDRCFLRSGKCSSAVAGDCRYVNSRHLTMVETDSFDSSSDAPLDG